MKKFRQNFVLIKKDACPTNFRDVSASTIPGGFVPPFKLDQFECYIWDANEQMAADFHGEEDCIRPRGWGWIHSTILRNGGTMEDAHAVMDAWEKWVEERASGCKDPQEAIKRFNA